MLAFKLIHASKRDPKSQRSDLLVKATGKYIGSLFHKEKLAEPASSLEHGKLITPM